MSMSQNIQRHEIQERKVLSAVCGIIIRLKQNQFQGEHLKVAFAWGYVPCPRTKINIPQVRVKEAWCSRRCLPYAAFKNESDLDLQDHVHSKNVIFKIRSLK